jgi:SAM-dependent methyltransferase
MDGMIPLEQCVAQAMDGGEEAAIVPFLPYILQDAWEIGTDARRVADLVRRLQPDHARRRVLDLGCGKGAVSVRLAQELGCRCLGIDALAEFVQAAGEKAREFGVERLCRFEQGDIRLRIHELGRFDVIVLGAIGPVFGDHLATLGILAPHLEAGGMIVVDDGWIDDDSPLVHPLVPRRGELLRQVAAAGMRIVEQVVLDRGDVAASDCRLFRDLETRCRELIARHPQRRALFEGYIRRQTEENDWLENRIACAVLAIRQDSAG